MKLIYVLLQIYIVQVKNEIPNNINGKVMKIFNLKFNVINLILKSCYFAESKQNEVYELIK